MVSVHYILDLSTPTPPPNIMSHSSSLNDRFELYIAYDSYYSHTNRNTSELVEQRTSCFEMKHTYTDRQTQPPLA
jgi:hypothetical protein